MHNKLANDILSDIIIHMKYARYNEKLQRRETWDELVTRNKNMHIKKFPTLKEEIELAYTYVYTKQILYQNNYNKEGKQQPEGLFQIRLKQFREKFYEEINLIRSTKANLLNFKLDGLIFTPFTTEYVIGGAWKKFMNIQYKWKPSEEQTIDFAVQNNSNNLFVFKYVPIQINIDKNYTTLENKLNTNSKFEFIYNAKKNNLNIIRELPTDHLITNLDTAQNLIEQKNDKTSIYLLITYNKFNNIILNALSNNSYYPLNIKKLVPFKLNKIDNATISSNFISELN